MFLPESCSKIWLYTEPTDMRKSFDGLSILVKHQLEENPLSGQLFIFINRRKTQLKALYFDKSGYCLWSKRLEQGQFNYTSDRQKKQSLNALDFRLLVEGIKIKKAIYYKRLSMK